jgi:hypothetical protein
MDAETVIFWCLVGALLGGLVGHLRGVMGLGMGLGLFLGPLLGPLAVLLLTLGGKPLNPRNLLEPRDQPEPPPS